MARNTIYVGLIIAGLGAVLWFVALFSVDPFSVGAEDPSTFSVVFSQLGLIGAWGGLLLAGIGAVLALFGRRQRPAA